MELTKNATVRRAANYGSSLVRLILMAFAAAVSASALATNTWYVAKEDVNAADTPAEGRGSEAPPHVAPLLRFGLLSCRIRR